MRSRRSAATVAVLGTTLLGSRSASAPAVVEVGHDQTLPLVVTSDHDDSLHAHAHAHAHGFEVERDLAAGVWLTLDLRGAEPGR